MNISGAQRRELNYFVNKVVTFIVPAINRSFNEESMIDYFVGKVTKVDEAGIWYEHIKTKCLNFLFFDKIISIAEEKIVEIEEPREENVSEVVSNPKEPPKNVEDLLQMFQT